MCAQNRAPATRSAGRQMSVFESSCSGRRSLRAAAPGLFETSKHERRIFIITNDGDDLRCSAHAAVLEKRSYGMCRGRLLGVKIAQLRCSVYTSSRNCNTCSSAPVGERRNQTELSVWAGEDNHGVFLVCYTTALMSYCR